VDKHTRLLEEARFAAKAAREIAEKADAENRDMTDDERQSSTSSSPRRPGQEATPTSPRS
jgi:hypothetical protein